MTELKLEAYGPRGDPSSHLSYAELEKRIAGLASPPSNTGTVKLITRRHPQGDREVLDETLLSLEEGIPGDGWNRRPPRDIDAQLSVMRYDLAGVFANGQPLTVFGDNLFVDLDISAANLPAGTRIRVCDAIVEVTPYPHTGCAKFGGRVGRDAFTLVREANRQEDNLRGMFWKVVEPGAIKTDGPIEVLKRP